MTKASALKTLAFTLFKPQRYDYLLLLKGSTYSFLLQLSSIWSCLSCSRLYFCTVAVLISTVTYVISGYPKVSISEFVFQIGMPLEYHHGSFPFSISHELGYAIFRRYAQKQMLVVRHHVPLYNLYAFPFAQILYDLLYVFSQCIVNYLSAILWCKDGMILTYPFGTP